MDVSGKSLFNNYKQALAILAEYTPQLEAFYGATGIAAQDIESWTQEELRYLKDVTAEEPLSPWKVDYVKLLRDLACVRDIYDSESMGVIEFHSLTATDFEMTGSAPRVSKEQKKMEAARAKVHANLLEAMIKVEEIEEREGVTQRWQPRDREYQGAERFIDSQSFSAAVDELEGKVVQRLLELSKANLAGTGTPYLFYRTIVIHINLIGYKMRRHISKSITRRSAALRTALDRYNELAPQQDPPRPMIDYKDVITFASLGDFDLLRYSRNEILSKPWTRPTNREISTKYYKVLRAREEIIRCNVEIRRLADWVDLEDELLAHTALSISETNPVLGLELRQLYDKQFRINNVHRVRLQSIRELDGYTGPTNSMRGHYSKPATNPVAPRHCDATEDLHNSDTLADEDEDEVTNLEDALGSLAT